MNYRIIAKNNMRYILVPKLEELGLKHCFTTIDMDMGLTTNGSVDSIKENFEFIYRFLGINPEVLFSGFQTHTNNIVVIKDLDQGDDGEFGKVFPETDGLVTDIENIALITRFADCTPIVLFDPVKKVHANIHSGWRGTLQRIGANGVDILVNQYGSNPEDIIAVMGPAIGKDEFEVDIDVMEMFKNEFNFHEEIINKKDDVKYLIDLRTTNTKILLEQGIKEENLIILDLPTMSNPMLHSFRRDKDKYGLMACITYL